MKENYKLNNICNIIFNFFAKMKQEIKRKKTNISNPRATNVNNYINQ